MSLETSDQKLQAVEAAIREISHIATLPEITVRIIELVEDPTSTAQDLHNVISHDPALCSRILKVVNSSFYGLPGQIGSINRAIVLLGLNAVKNIAISASLAKLFRGGELCKNFSARSVWVHSITTAAASKLIADEIGLGVSDEAFLSGLIHEIGVMVELQYDRDKLIEVVSSLDVKDGTPAVDMREAELRVFGADHEDFGASLCERWKFPKMFANVCGAHHNPAELPAEARKMPSLVHIADHAAGTVHNGYRLDLVQLAPHDAALDEIGLTKDKYHSVVERLADSAEEAAVLLA